MFAATVIIGSAAAIDNVNLKRFQRRDLLHCNEQACARSSCSGEARRLNGAVSSQLPYS